MASFFMNTPAKKIPGTWQAGSLYEYLLVAHPSPEIYALIEKEKEWFTGEYKQAIAGKTRPHITIANFLANEEMEQTINRWLQNICSLATSFPVSLNNYGGFPPHTIYLRVQNPQPFQQLAKQLQTVDDFIRASACPPATTCMNSYSLRPS